MRINKYAVLGHFGPFWAILGHFGPFWAILCPDLGKSFFPKTRMPDLGTTSVLWHVPKTEKCTF